jgi:MFS family permease
MYLSQRVFLCFSWTLLPIILRTQGASLGAVGFSALVYSPWALKFLYASWVDRTKAGRLGRRKTWIVPLLLLSVVVLPLLAMFSTETDMTIILILVAILNIIFATIDIAVDGYATDILTPKERPWGNTIQTGGYVLGYMLGAGVSLVIFQKFGWSITIFLITAFQLLLMLPILFHKEISPIDFAENRSAGHARTAGRPSMWVFIKQPGIAWFFLFAGLLMIAEHGGLQLRLPLMVDLGISPAKLGSFNIWIGSPLCIVGAVIGGTLLSYLGNRTVLHIICAGLIFLCLFTSIVSTESSPGFFTISTMLGIEKLISGISTTYIFSLIMGLSVGRQSATNYAVLGSLVQLIQFFIMPVSGNVCDQFGYFNVYIALAIFALITVIINDNILRRSLFTDKELAINK